MSLTVQVEGIYGLPEEWASKQVSVTAVSKFELQDDPTEQSYQYEVKVFGTHFKGGKFLAKEESEADAGTESKVDSKKPPAKGKTVEVEELTEEQKAQLAQAQAEREKYNATKMMEWDQMNGDERFYTTAEDKSVEPRIEFPMLPPPEGEEEPVRSNVMTIVLDEEALKAFESNVNDPAKRTLKILVEKAVPQAGAEDTKKAPAKGKATTEEAKPVLGEAVLDLIPLMYPGQKETTQRCFIETQVPRPGTIESGEGDLK